MSDEQTISNDNETGTEQVADIVADRDEKEKVGRPLKFKDKEELQKKITEYFDKCSETGKPLTITGLAVALDTFRSVLIDYESKDEFSYTIKKAKEYIHAWTEEYLFTGKNQTGAIFNLKNNYGWKDSSQTDITSGGEQLGVIMLPSK